MKHWIVPAMLAVLASPDLSAAENMVTYDPVAKAEKMLKRMDKDGNGSVSEEEYFRPSNFRFNRFDTDNNNYITRDELINFWKQKRKIATNNPNAWNGPTDAHFTRFDSNKDEKITREEYQATTRAAFDKLDADNNKMISQEELNDHWINRRKDLDEFNESDSKDDD